MLCRLSASATSSLILPCYAKACITRFYFAVSVVFIRIVVGAAAVGIVVVTVMPACEAGIITQYVHIVV